MRSSANSIASDILERRKTPVVAEMRKTMVAIRAAFRARGLSYSVTGRYGVTVGSICISHSAEGFCGNKAYDAATKKLCRDLGLEPDIYTFSIQPSRYAEFIERAKGTLKDGKAWTGQK